jgi:hypothetical protein
MQRRQSSTFAWPTLCAAVLVAMLFGAVGRTLQGGWGPTDAGAVMAPAPLLLAGPEERLHCSSCGWIEAKREIVPELVAPHALKIYEYTLRMADGSVSLFQETQPTTWRLGERVMLIEGSGPQ